MHRPFVVTSLCIVLTAAVAAQEPVSQLARVNDIGLGLLVAF